MLDEMEQDRILEIESSVDNNWDEHEDMRAELIALRAEIEMLKNVQKICLAGMSVGGEEQ